MKYIQSIFYVFLLNSVLFAQAPDTLWTKTLGGNEWDEAYSVQQTTDGGYIIIGSTESFGAGDYDVWLIRTDANGDTIWTRTFGGDDRDWGSSVQQTTDGGYIITGSTRSFGAGEDDVWLIRTDAYGDTIWTRTFGGDDRDWGSSVQQTTDGGYIITGSTQSFGAGWQDVWLIRADANGDTLWTRTFGGDDGDSGHSVQQTTDGGYIIIGNTRVGFYASDAWLLKTDAGGDTLWTQIFGIQGIYYGNSVQQTADGGYILILERQIIGIGRNYSSIIKTDASGDTLWTRTFGEYNGGIGNSVQQTADNGFIIIGNTYSFGADSNDTWLIKTDTSGDTLWTKTFGGSGNEGGRSVQQTTDGGYIITGYTTSFGAGKGDIWLIKTAPDITGINRSEVQPISFTLHQNYPNPFNPATTIEFTLPQSGFVTLKVYNLLGEEVATLLKAHKPAGQYAINFDASQLTSGVYYYTLTADGFKQTRKMVLLR